jgi:hypothetical protein
VRRVGAGLGVVAAVAVGVWLRVAAAKHGYAPDELANITPKGALAIITDPESGVNPPLLRLVVNLASDTGGSLVWGRALSMLCGVLAIPAVAALARRVGGLGAMVAAAWILALHLDAVRMSGQIRAYSPFVLVAALHLLAVMRWADAPDQRGRRWAVALSALLLPQLHYFGVPLLLGVAGPALLDPTTRRLWRLYVPSALALLPLVQLITGDHEARVVMKGGLSDTLLLMLSLDLQGVPEWASRLFGWLRLRSDLTDHALQAAITTGLLVVSTWRLRPWSTDTRVLVGALVGVLAGVLGFSSLQYVRSPVALYVAVSAIPLLVAWVGRAKTTLGAVAVVIGLAAGLGPGLARGLTDLNQRWPEDAAPDFVGTFHDYDAVRGGRPVYVTPRHALNGLFVAFSGRPLADARERGAGECARDRDCFVWEGVPFRLWTEGAPPNGLVFGVEDIGPLLQLACTVVAQGPFSVVLDCR